MPELNQDNLARYNAGQRRPDEAPVKQTIKRFREETDPYRSFLVTGHSVRQPSARAKNDKSNGVEQV